MTKKCCVPGFSSNYEKDRAKKKKNCEGNSKENIQYVPVHGLPSEVFNKEERRIWIDTIPGLKHKIDNMKQNPVVCIKHWPADHPKKPHRGGFRPINPPSIFEEVAKSTIPTPPPKPRPTKRSSFEIRTSFADDLERYDLDPK